MAMRPELKSVLIETGREIGTAMLESAVSSAPTVEVMQNQVFTLRQAAIHILAMTVYNDERLGGRDAEDSLDELSDELEREFQFAQQCENESQLDLFIPGALH